MIKSIAQWASEAVNVVNRFRNETGREPTAEEIYIIVRDKWRELPDEAVTEIKESTGCLTALSYAKKLWVYVEEVLTQEAQENYE